MSNLHCVVHLVIIIVCVVRKLSNTSLVIRGETAHIDRHIMTDLQHLSTARQENHKLLVVIFVDKDWYLEELVIQFTFELMELLPCLLGEVDIELFLDGDLIQVFKAGPH